MKRILSLLLTVIFTLSLFPAAAYAAPDWPADVAIEADGGIVMDADSGAVLFGKNLHETYYPASITKVLTALIVLEHCSLDEEVTFSYDAVYNVESGSSNAGIDEGDVLTVRDCLYALLLQSANEAANALAEHVSGSREAFAELMNETAASLGCQDSHFANPSGLNDENHYTSAYDMALICRAAIQNPMFLEIDGARYYDLPPTRNYPEGSTVYAHHAMLLPSRSQYYEGAFGGKTGYTKQAGRTLVSSAEKEGLEVFAVTFRMGDDFAFHAQCYDEVFANYDDVLILRPGSYVIDGKRYLVDEELRICLKQGETYQAEEFLEDGQYCIETVVNDEVRRYAYAQDGA